MRLPSLQCYQQHHYHYIYSVLEIVVPEFLCPFLKDVDGFLPCVLGYVLLIGSAPFYSESWLSCLHWPTVLFPLPSPLLRSTPYLGSYSMMAADKSSYRHTYLAFLIFLLWC